MKNDILLTNYHDFAPGKLSDDNTQVITFQRVDLHIVTTFLSVGTHAYFDLEDGSRDCNNIKLCRVHRRLARSDCHRLECGGTTLAVRVSVLGVEAGTNRMWQTGKYRGMHVTW